MRGGNQEIGLPLAGREILGHRELKDKQGFPVLVLAELLYLEIADNLGVHREVLRGVANNVASDRFKRELDGVYPLVLRIHYAIDR